MDLLKSLIVLSQKAANIARVCRKDEHLFDLLVQKKKSEEANPRFVQDFKTLADVLIQEMVKHDVIKKFPELSGSILGEESNIFKNKLGETICVEVKASQAETSCLLEKVLNGDRLAADLLALEVHKDIEIEAIRTAVPQGTFDLDLSTLGLWIDPIDCTAEYIQGNFGNVDHEIDINGLKCVTVLIGVYNKVTGSPVMGVINRPFTDDKDSVECIWGVSLPNCSECVVDVSTERKNVICISSSEKEEIKMKLNQGGFHLVEASGAGFKILTVILGFADAYLISKGTTFKWDTCAPHAVLKSLGGDVVDFKNTIENEKTSIVYSCDQTTCNSDGLIAYKNEDILNEIVKILCE